MEDTEFKPIALHPDLKLLKGDPVISFPFLYIYYL